MVRSFGNAKHLPGAFSRAASGFEVGTLRGRIRMHDQTTGEDDPCQHHFPSNLAHKSLLYPARTGLLPLDNSYEKTYDRILILIDGKSTIFYGEVKAL
jgi:hypothetical protein